MKTVESLFKASLTKGTGRIRQTRRSGIHLEGRRRRRKVTLARDIVGHRQECWKDLVGLPVSALLQSDDATDMRRDVSQHRRRVSPYLLPTTRQLVDCRPSANRA